LGQGSGGQQNTFAQSVKMAQNLETIQNDHKKLQRIATIKAELQPDEASNIIWEDLIEQEIKQIPAIQARNNCFPAKMNANGPPPNNGQACNSNTRNPNIICRYCQKKGHLQKECFSRHRDSAPMVDANSKRYETNHVNNLANKLAIAS